MEKDEHYIKTVVKLAGVVEDLIKCNNAIDIYEEYFPEVGLQSVARHASLHPLVLHQPAAVDCALWPQLYRGL